MPRIQIIPVDPAIGWSKCRADGTIVVDICRVCRPRFKEGEPIPQDVLEQSFYIGGVFDTGDIVGSVLKHPPFEGRRCACCEATLTEQDN